jgi:TIR domain/SIR2-like domain
MADSRTAESEVRELRALVERIKRGDCILVLGPHVAVRADDPQRTPLDEQLARELLESLGEPAGQQPPNMRRAADAFYRQRKDRDELELTVADFYRRGEGTTTDFHRDLAALPFRLCVAASPDSLMLAAFAAAGKKPQKGWYSFRGAATPRLSAPTVQTPLVYHLFGHSDDPTSFVLTEGDLIEFLVAVVKGTPVVPDQVRSMLADPAAAFLFVGFGFHNWYLRVLLQVMNIYNHRSKALAFEDETFFAHPEREQTVGFFSGDRLIDFRPLRWSGFAQQLREVYEASAPAPPAPVVTKRMTTSMARPAVGAATPKVFVSYASEDQSAVDALVGTLQGRGVQVWQDKQDLRAGANWSNVLFDVIRNRVDYTVVVQTPAMTSRVEGIFHREIDAALERQAGMGELDGIGLRFLIPVKIGNCPLLSTLKYAHVIDVSEPQGVDALVQSIQEDWRRRTILTSGTVRA